MRSVDTSARHLVSPDRGRSVAAKCLRRSVVRLLFRPRIERKPLQGRELDPQSVDTSISLYTRSVYAKCPASRYRRSESTPLVVRRGELARHLTSLTCGRVMGKRSSFERRERDFYPTPRAAVLPLIPHLRGIRTFAEPCCWRRRAGPASGIVRPALRLCRRHRDRPGCACARPLRRGRCDHHQPALHPPGDARADRALPAHCANLAVTGLRTGRRPGRRRRSCPAARTS